MSVLVAADVDHAPDQPIAVGYDLANACDESLVVLYVAPEDEFQKQQQSRENLPEEFQSEFTLEHAEEDAAARATETVEETLGSYDRQRVTTRGRIGDPAEEIIAVAAELDPRLVVVGGRRRSLAKQALFGSVSQEILREAEQPVVTIMERGD